MFVCDNSISCLRKNWSQGVERDLKCPLDQLLHLIYKKPRSRHKSTQKSLSKQSRGPLGAARP